MKKKRELVAYYSYGGNTKIAAEIYAEKNDALIFKIEPIKRPKGKLGFIISVLWALLKLDVKIESVPMEIFDGVEEITIASPVWASSLTPAVNAFIRQAPLQERRVNIITVQADEKHEASEKIFNYVARTIGSHSASVGKMTAITGSAPGIKPDREEIAKQFG